MSRECVREAALALDALQKANWLQSVLEPMVSSESSNQSAGPSINQGTDKSHGSQQIHDFTHLSGESLAELKTVWKNSIKMQENDIRQRRQGDMNSQNTTTPSAATRQTSLGSENIQLLTKPAQCFHVLASMSHSSHV
jgi:hypothetical protein